jgi:hypothetical protein
MELNNPLRPTVKRPLPETTRTTAATETTPTPRVNPPGVAERPQTKPTPEMKPAPTVNLDAPEIRRAIELLAKNGVEIAEPKKNYIKHSYEIEEELHTLFHEMHSVLGFKTVKSAMNSAIRMWCDAHKAEFKRRRG